MAVFLYLAAFAAIFFSGFALPFATRRMSTAVVFMAAALVLFFGGYLMATFQNAGPYASEDAPRLSFLMVLALSVLPFAAGSLARLITLVVFKDEPNKPVGVFGVGAATTVLFGGLGMVMFGLF